jgi:hypothetical protein
MSSKFSNSFQPNGSYSRSQARPAKSQRILVLGNDPQINSIKFDRLAKDVVTIGVNRIWLKHIPNFYFFHDYDILSELMLDQERLLALQMGAKCFSSDWLAYQARKASGRIPGWIRVHARNTKSTFPDSVSTAMRLFIQHYLTSTSRTFYIAGVSLKWKEPSHFWKVDEYQSRNDKDVDWYLPRFDKMLENFKSLKSTGTQIVSVNPDSRLNGLFRYEGIDSLYH